MIRFLLISILITLIARAFWRVMDGVIDAMGGRSPSQPPARSMKLVRDPVCGTFVARPNAIAMQGPSGPKYFCSERCRDAFVASAPRPPRPIHEHTR